MVRPMLSHRCPVCPLLSVCNVGLLWPNGWMDQDETWHGGRPRPWPYCVRWGPSSLSPKGHSPQIFGPCLLWPKGWMDQDSTWYGGSPRPKRHCVRWWLSSAPKKGTQPPISAHVYCGQMAGWIKMPLGTKIGLGPCHTVLDGDPAPPLPQRGTAPIFCRCLLWPNGHPSQLLVSNC